MSDANSESKTVYDDLPFSGTRQGANQSQSEKDDRKSPATDDALGPRFRFSLWQLIVMLTMASIVLGIVGVTIDFISHLGGVRNSLIVFAIVVTFMLVTGFFAYLRSMRYRSHRRFRRDD